MASNALLFQQMKDQSNLVMAYLTPARQTERDRYYPALRLWAEYSATYTERTGDGMAHLIAN